MTARDGADGGGRGRGGGTGGGGGGQELGAGGGRDGPRAEPQLVEELAHAFGAFGVPRMAGRILGRLLVSTEPYETLDSLAESLGASKGSMSTMARLLVGAGLVERVAVPGGRRDHYRIKPGAWPELNRDRVEAVSRLGALAAALVAAGGAGGAGAASTHSDGGQALAELSRFCDVAERELRALPRRVEGEGPSAPAP